MERKIICISVFSSKGVSNPTDPADPSWVLSDLLKRADIEILSIVYASETC